VDPGTLVLAAAVMAVGAALQAAVGFGGNLVAAPLLALLDPGLVPVPILIGSTAINVVVALREHGHSGWPDFGWVLAGRLPGSLLGLALLRALDPSGLQLVLGVSLLLALVATLGRWSIPATPHGLFSAGVVSGVGGTAVSVGGPPVALVYQHRHGAELRGTLARVLLAGQGISIAVLALGGQIGRTELGQGLILVPAVLLGVVGGRPLAAVLDQGRTRAAVLAVCAASALMLLVEALR
jgi:uncharacterized membrane protein YfcA